MSQHPPIGTQNLSPFSSLCFALEEHRVNESFVEDTFRVPRTSRGLLLKPLAPWRGQHKIQFDALPSVYSGRGVPLSLIASGIAPGGIFRDCMEPVFCGSILMLRVSWPGYSGLDAVVKVPLRGRATRGDVAKAVFDEYTRMFERARMEPTPTHESWVIGKNRITVHNLVLLSVANDAEGVYEAEIHLVHCRDDPAAMFAAMQREVR